MRKRKEIETEAGKVTINELKAKEILEFQECIGKGQGAFVEKVQKIAGIKKEDFLEFTFSDMKNLIDAFFEVNSDFLQILDLFTLKKEVLAMLEKIKQVAIQEFLSIQERDNSQKSEES